MNIRHTHYLVSSELKKIRLFEKDDTPQQNTCMAFFMFYYAPNFEEVEGYIGLELYVPACVRACVRASVRHAFWCMPYPMNRAC